MAPEEELRSLWEQFNRKLARLKEQIRAEKERKRREAAGASGEASSEVADAASRASARPADTIGSDVEDDDDDAADDEWRERATGRGTQGRRREVEEILVRATEPGHREVPSGRHRDQAERLVDRDRVEVLGTVGRESDVAPVEPERDLVGGEIDRDDVLVTAKTSNYWNQRVSPAFFFLLISFQKSFGAGSEIWRMKQVMMRLTRTIILSSVSGVTILWEKGSTFAHLAARKSSHE